MHIPSGFGTRTPYIFADDAEGYIQFLENALGGVSVGSTRRGDGKIANCQMQLGDTMFMISEASEIFPASRAAFYFFVGDADAAMDRAITAGARLVMEVGDMPYGDRQGGVSDPSGNIWWISQRLSDEPYY